MAAKHYVPDKQQRESIAQRDRYRLPLHAPPHNVRAQSHYLVTAACFQHACIMFSPERRKHFSDHMLSVLANSTCDAIAWAVFPDHYHLLVVVDRFADLGQCVRLLHGASAREWNIADVTPGRKVWYRYTDRAIRDERHLYATLNYIHYNPVKHGWAKSPYEWEQSSVGLYRDRLGVEWLRDCWERYPVLDYGKGWDDSDSEGKVTAR